MISISIIGYNEERNIGRCLESCSWADEIVFTDCGSIDKTVEIASKVADKILYRPNNPNLNVNKQFSIDNCSGDWILYIDPDEVITEELKNEILSVIKSDNRLASGYLIPRKNYYFDKFLRFGGKYPDYQLRLFMNGSGRFQCKSVHERISISGIIKKLKSPILHYPYINVADMMNKSDFYTSRKAEKMFIERRSPRFILLRPAFKFIKNYILKRGFLDGYTGWVTCLMDAHNEFITMLKLKEMYNEKKFLFKN